MRDEVLEMKKEVNEVKKQSFAMELLQDAKKTNKRMFVMWLITFVALVGVVCYLVYVLNDTSTVETTEISQENADGYNNYIGNDGDITNGKADN